MENQNSKYILSSVYSTLSILNLFYDHEELSVADIVRETEMNRSTVFRSLVTLESLDYLKRGNNGLYRLGMRIFTLGQAALSRMEIITNVHPYLLDIAAQTGETANLALWNDASNTMVVDKALSSAQLKMDTVLGLRHSAHLTAGGKALLAFESPAFISNYISNTHFEKLTPNTIADAQQLLSNLSEIRANGYAEETEESELGLSCLAVPLLERGRPIGAISVSGPTSRLAANREHIVDILCATAAKLND